jgi:hypothetical protein
VTRAHRVDDGPARNLRRQSKQSARGQDETDIGLAPSLRGEIDRDERAESGLDVGKEKSEPVESAQAAGKARRPRGRRLGRPPLKERNVRAAVEPGDGEIRRCG